MTAPPLYVDPFLMAVPTVDGEPLLKTYDARTYELYVRWLAEFLYRPGHQQTVLPDLSLEEARVLVGAIEHDIACWIWDHPFADYPPGLRKGDPRHADVMHRVQLSKILSRVPDPQQRIELIDRFYTELQYDAAK